MKNKVNHYPPPDTSGQLASLVQPQRQVKCPLCGASPGLPCAIPPGDHLARWTASREAGHVTRDDVSRCFSRAFMVFTGAAIIPDAPLTAGGAR